MGPDDIKVPLLTGSNFNIWRKRVELILDANEMLFVLEDGLHHQLSAESQLAWRKLDKKAKVVISNGIPDEFFGVIEDKKTAKDMMDALFKYFNDDSLAQQSALKRELFELKMDESKGLKEHFSVFEELVRKLKASGVCLKPIDELHYLFMSLPTKFDTVATILENSSGMTVNMAKPKLISEEIKLKSKEEKRGKDLGKDDGIPAAMHAKVKCFVCSKEGHKSFECPLNVAMVAKKNFMDTYQRNKPETKKKVTWVLDSGATNHIVNDVRCLKSVQNMRNRSEIQLAEFSKSVTATKKGCIDCYSNKKVKLEIKDVLYVPELRYNLLSLRKLTSLGLVIVFVGNRAIIKKNGMTVGTGYLKDGLYEFDVTLLDQVGAN